MRSVDCVIVAGDVFDTSAPAPEAERLVYGFFGELYGAGIPAVGDRRQPRPPEAAGRGGAAADVAGHPRAGCGARAGGRRR